jgi:DNA-3-methyladenine glycosylase
MIATCVVLLMKAETRPENTTTTTRRSPLRLPSRCTRRLLQLARMPVRSMAAARMSMQRTMMVASLEKPDNPCSGVRTPVSIRRQAAPMAVMAGGMSSVTSRMKATSTTRSVMRSGASKARAIGLGRIGACQRGLDGAPCLGHGRQRQAQSPWLRSAGVAVLPPAFYAREAEAVARDLLGKVLVLRVDDASGAKVVRRARITETEAYVGEHDLASHSSKGRTARNEAMFGPPGRAYVYLVYGMHHCLNVVTGKAGEGQAVLLRAAEPLDGWDADLRGPGRLARAFGLTRLHDKADLVRGRERLRVHDGPPPARVKASARIGVDYAKDWAHAPLRFHDASSPHVSRRPSAGRATSRRTLGDAGRRDRNLRPQGPDGPAMPTTLNQLAQERCEPCDSKTPRIGRAEAERLALALPAWRLKGNATRLVREWTLKDFRAALALANGIGRLAEEEGHHPDLHLTDYKRLRAELSTHAIDGLSRNDFVLAAKIDQMAPPQGDTASRPARRPRRS